MGNASNLLVPGATCQDLLSCAFDLNELERLVYLCLLGQPEHTLDELASHVARDRSTIHRAVSKLVSLGLVAKENRGLAGGGYYQAYKAAPPERVAQLVQERFDLILTRVAHLVETFPHDVRHMANETGARVHAREKRRRR